MSRVAVLQSNYIPWKGYFDIIRDVETFIFYDDVQFTKNDWRNRNCIKTQNGRTWLTVPVGADINRRICDVSISDTRWQKKHWRSLEQYYVKAPYFELYREQLSSVFQAEWSSLSTLNRHLIELIAVDFLGIEVRFLSSESFSLQGDKHDRLLNLLGQVGATRYISGPAAKSYIDETRFARAGVDIAWKDYSGYPEYPQAYPPFEHSVSILDLLFQTGPKAPWYIWGWRGDQKPHS